MTPQYFEHDGIKLAHRIDGTPGGPPILLLHGLSEALGTYDEIVNRLHPSLEIHRLDFRGHGDSDRDPGSYDVPRQAADVVAFIDRVVGRPVFLGGHSSGGVVAHVVAQRHPEHVVAVFEEDPPLYFCDHSLFQQTDFAKFFPMVAGQIRALQIHNVPEHDVREAIRNSPGVRGGIVGDDMNDISINARAYALMHCDPETIDTQIAGRQLVGYDPDEPIARPLTILRADPAFGAALPPDQAGRLAASQPHATITEAAGATHLIHADTHTVDAYLAHLRAALNTAFTLDE
jgi:esterase